METSEATGRIRIIKTPAGEAPGEVRRAWIGLELPCLPELAYPGAELGILTGAISSRRRRVFAVPQEGAIAVLREANPNAAMWWRMRGFPNSLLYFSFGEDEAEIVSGVTHQKIEVWSDQDGDPRK